MKRILFFVMLFLGIVSISTAKQLEVATARQIAKNMYLQVDNTKANLNFKLVYTAVLNMKSEEEIPLFYVFNVEDNNGFVIVSAHDNTLPILGYATIGSFNNVNMPANVAAWLDNYKQQIQYIVDNELVATPKIQEQWTRLANKQSLHTNKDATSVDPLIPIKWGQSPYVNDLCPYDEAAGSGNGYHCPTGCPATAMAMIMKYWEYPIQGTGSHSYTHQNYGIQSADFGATTYNWRDMPHKVNSENNAVATLMYHCGVGVEMDYGPDASGSFVIMDGYPAHKTCEYAYKTYFGYNPSTIQGLWRYKHPDAQWKQMLKTNLDNANPIQYAGFGDGTGHTFLCDGYDEEGKFHMNWGWDGMYDGFYELEALNPGTGGTGGGSGHFNNNQQAIIGLQPLEYTAPLQPDTYEDNNTPPKARTLPVEFVDNHAIVTTEGSNIHVPSDDDYYKILLMPGKKYVVKARVHDKANAANGNTYDCDVYWSYKVSNGAEWSEYYDDVMPDSLFFENGAFLYFKVLADSDQGSYLLDIDITRVSHEGIEDIAANDNMMVYPNPATSQLIVKVDTKVNKIEVLDLLGKQMIQIENPVLDNENFVVPIEHLVQGAYMILVETEQGVLKQKFIKQ